MLEPTKMLHTDDAITLSFYGPVEYKDEAITVMETFGFVEASEPVTARELFADYTDQELPGAALRGARYREGLTQSQLAALTGIPQRHISEMEHGKRPIGKKNARIFAKALGMAGYKVFL